MTEEVKLTFFMLKILGFDRGSKTNIFHAENTTENNFQDNILVTTENDSAHSGGH